MKLRHGLQLAYCPNVHLPGALDWLAENPQLYSHLEMETYTWEVLPAALKSQNAWSSSRQNTAGRSPGWRNAAWPGRKLTDKTCKPAHKKSAGIFQSRRS